ncbi:MAG: hypothetical protein J6T72_00645 [Alphaproteobacteria bacterium]|nr:hypothetical protein [Alphaproteobacteria bacterium]
MKNFFEIFKIEEERASALTWSAATIVGISFCFGWKYALVSLFSVFLTHSHSLRLYREGCYDNVVDEHEYIDGGFPKDGWKKLQKGLKSLSIFLVILGIFLSIIYTLPSIQNADVNICFAGTDYSIPYTFLIPFIIGLILFFSLIYRATKKAV